MTDLTGPLLHGLALVGVFLLAGGVGSFAFGSKTPPTWRGLALQHLIGFIGYAVLLAVAAQGARLDLLGAGVVIAIYLGSGGAAIIFRSCDVRADVARRIAVVGGLGLTILGMAALRGNAGALDPTTYAFATTALFEDHWMHSELSQLTTYAWLVDTMQDVVVSRVPSIAILWPGAALGFGVSAQTVFSMASWLILVSIVLFADVLSTSIPLPVRLLLAAGAVGLFNQMAVLAGGQINQAFAVCIGLAVVWAVRWASLSRTRLTMLALTGAAVAAGYPEFLLALPIYLLCALLARPHSMAATVQSGAAVLGGVAAIQVTSRLGNIHYLLAQVEVRPGWWPLVAEPHNIAELWATVIFQRSLSISGLAVAVVAAGVAIALIPRLMRTMEEPKLPLSTIAASLAVLLVCWSAVALHSPNANYAAFKVGGWIAPGLLLCAWLLVGRLGPSSQRIAMSLLVLVSTVRLVGLSVETPWRLAMYASIITSPVWTIAQEPGGCVVYPGADQPESVMAAISESAAPRHNCHVQVL